MSLKNLSKKQLEDKVKDYRERLDRAEQKGLIRVITNSGIFDLWIEDRKAQDEFSKLLTATSPAWVIEQYYTELTTPIPTEGKEKQKT